MSERASERVWANVEVNRSVSVCGAQMHLISTCVLIVLCFVGHMASSAAELRTYEGPYSLYRALNF